MFACNCSYIVEFVSTMKETFQTRVNHCKGWVKGNLGLYFKSILIPVRISIESSVVSAQAQVSD